MKILVIDDNPLNRESAKQTIIGHDLLVVDGWDAAMNVLGTRYDKEAIKAKLVAAGLPAVPEEVSATWSRPWSEENNNTWKSWWAAYDKSQKESQIPYWDVVLSDLLMPASRETMGDKGMKFVGQEMPLGFAIVLLAALNGAKYVAVATATNHHHHPAVAALDRFRPDYGRPAKPNFVINGAKAMFMGGGAHYVEGTVCSACGGDQAKMPECWDCNKTGKVRAKNWGYVLARLTAEEVIQSTASVDHKE